MEERLRILLCEDDENLGMLLREYLQAKGFNADLFPDGEAGYKAFLKGKYDLCVFDVMMPKKDGFALAQEVRLLSLPNGRPEHPVRSRQILRPAAHNFFPYLIFRCHTAFLLC